MAAGQGNSFLVKFLLDKGALITHNNLGLTAFVVAVLKKQEEVTRTFLLVS